MILDQLCYNFLKNKTADNILGVLYHLRNQNEFKLSIIISKFFSKYYPDIHEILQEYCIASYYNKDYVNAYTGAKELLKFNLDENFYNITLFNQHFSINHICDNYIYYNKEKIQYIMTRKQKEFPLVTLTITTCKRFDLFEKTINSVLNCFDIDMIDYWFCVDDNSSEEDRIKMKKLYPFFTFYFKNYEEKGHPISMNIIRNYVLEKTKTPYLLHMEDDWKFFDKRNYISDAINVLANNRNLGQCLFNKNYTEKEGDISIKGGEFKVTNKNIRYYIHEYVYNDELKNKWIEKHGYSNSSNYWPHFSFRPSVIRSKVFEDVGSFNKEIHHFEMEYAHRYFQKNYISAFFEGIYCLHTGRLTSQIHDKTAINAYTLNNEKQFDKKSISLDNFDSKIKTYVLNLDRRPDRWDNFKNNCSEIDFLNYQRFSAVDGLKIKSTEQLQRIFNNNDYNMKAGMVGCLMSHIKMYIELIYSDYDLFCILEDDITFTSNFDKKFLHLYNQLKNEKWDLIYIGHHIRNMENKHIEFHTENLPIIEKVNTHKSFLKSLGGTTGYLISKSGAQKLLDFISLYGATNCIDTLQQKSANIMDVFYCTPHLIYSDCFDNNNSVDTDIQRNITSLSIPYEEKVKNEMNFYSDMDLLKSNYEDIVNKISTNDEFILYCEEKIDEICELCKNKNINYYTIENKIIFIVTKKNINKYFHSFKINDKYSIDDCILE